MPGGRPGAALDPSERLRRPHAVPCWSSWSGTATSWPARPATAPSRTSGRMLASSAGRRPRGSQRPARHAPLAGRHGRPRPPPTRRAPGGDTAGPRPPAPPAPAHRRAPAVWSAPSGAQHRHVVPPRPCRRWTAPRRPCTARPSAPRSSPGWPRGPRRQRPGASPSWAPRSCRRRPPRRLPPGGPARPPGRVLLHERLPGPGPAWSAPPPRRPPRSCCPPADLWAAPGEFGTIDAMTEQRDPSPHESDDRDSGAEPRGSSPRAWDPWAPCRPPPRTPARSTPSRSACTTRSPSPQERARDAPASPPAWTYDPQPGTSSPAVHTTSSPGRGTERAARHTSSPAVTGPRASTGPPPSRAPEQQWQQGRDWTQSHHATPGSLCATGPRLGGRRGSRCWLPSSPACSAGWRWVARCHRPPQFGRLDRGPSRSRRSAAAPRAAPEGSIANIAAVPCPAS